MKSNPLDIFNKAAGYVDNLIHYEKGNSFYFVVYCGCREHIFAYSNKTYTINKAMKKIVKECKKIKKWSLQNH